MPLVNRVPFKRGRERGVHFPVLHFQATPCDSPGATSNRLAISLFTKSNAGQSYYELLQI